MADWWKVFKGDTAPQRPVEDRDFAAEALAMLPSLPYGPETWTTWTNAVKEKTGRKGRALFMPLRLAVTGRAHGPEMADVMPLMQVAPKL